MLTKDGVEATANLVFELLGERQNEVLFRGESLPRMFGDLLGRDGVETSAHLFVHSSQINHRLELGNSTCDSGNLSGLG